MMFINPHYFSPAVIIDVHNSLWFTLCTLLCLWYDN